MGQQINQIEGQGGGRDVNLRQASRAVYKRMRAVAALAIGAALGMTAIVYSMPDHYAAGAIIQIDPRQKPTAQLDTSWPESDRQSIESEIEMLRSAPVLDHVIGALRLDSDPEFKPHRLAAFFDRWFKTASPRTQTRAALAEALTVRRVRNTFLVSVRSTASSPEKSALINNAVVEAYLQQRPARFPISATDSHESAGDGTDAASGPTAAQRMFQTLLARYGLGRKRPGTHILVKAKPPRAPAGPNRLELVVAAFGAGLLVAVALALFLERQALSSARPRNVQRTLACPHMASLPAIEHDNVSPPARAARLILTEPTCPYAAAIRNACSELQRRRPQGGSRIVLVVSALPGEGAEHFASNIAHSLAIAGQPPLLVDADLRMKNLTRQLAPEAPAGLLDQIAARRPIEEAILRDSSTGLFFLPAAGPAPIPLSVPGVLRSAEFATVVAALKQSFATVIVSVPPLLPVSDARIVAELADEIVFVTAWNRTPRSLATKAVASLETNHRKVIGAVLTDIAEEDSAPPMSFAAIFDEIRHTALATLAARAA